MKLEVYHELKGSISSGHWNLFVQLGWLIKFSSCVNGISVDIIGLFETDVFGVCVHVALLTTCFCHNGNGLRCPVLASYWVFLFYIILLAVLRHPPLTTRNLTWLLTSTLAVKVPGLPLSHCFIWYAWPFGKKRWMDFLWEFDVGSPNSVNLFTKILCLISSIFCVLAYPSAKEPVLVLIL